MNTRDFFQMELDRLESLGLKRRLSYRDTEIENLSSNDYLGLSTHPEVMAGARKALDHFGAGGTSSRLLAGTLELHSTFEREIAQFLKKETALLFASGYHVNTGLIPCLMGAGDVIFVDRLCHASIIDGVRLSEAKFYTFDHNDTADLAKLLESKRENARNALVISEGIFSMDGDVAPLSEIAMLAHRNNALFYLDEAHSFGMWGPDGRGAAAACGALPYVDIFVGTLSKALGSNGGFVAGDETFIEFFKSRARSFIYTTALPPASVGAGLSALKILPLMGARRRLVLETAAQLRKQLHEMGYNTMKSSSQIVPVLTGDVAETQNLSNHLFERGFFVPSIRPPTVPVGEGRVRISVTHEVATKSLRPLVESFKTFPGRPTEVNNTIVETR